VRAVLDRYQPMLSLHGHIHESRGGTKLGRTVALNPGSEYSEGVLRGALATLAATLAAAAPTPTTPRESRIPSG
jgi:Icc-related predicted phosphoesterase